MTSLLPPNASKLERAVEQATVRINGISVPIADMWDPDRCPVSVLPFLAWSWSVDNWDSNWSEAIKRQVVKSAIKVHRHKGTPGAVKDALSAIEVGATISEWFDYGGDPYRFRIEVELEQRGLSEDETNTLRAIALATKNVRSHLDDMKIYLTSRSRGPFVAASAMVGNVLSVFPLDLSEIILDHDPVPIVAAGPYFVNSLTIHPQN